MQLASMLGSGKRENGGKEHGDFGECRTGKILFFKRMLLDVGKRRV